MTLRACLFEWTGDDVELRRRAQVLAALGLLGSVATLGGASARLFLHGPGFDSLISYLFSPVGALCPIIARRLRSVAVPSWILLLLGTLTTILVAYGEGGTLSPAALWLPVMPLAATFLLGWKGGAAFLGLVVTSLWVLVGAPSPAEPPATPTLWAISAVMSGTFAFACVAAFDLARQSAVGRIGRLVREAEGRNASLARANEDLVVAHRQAQAASQLKSEFMTTMSHELRTPLNSVIGFSNYLLKNKSGGFGERDIKMLDRIRFNGIHLLSIIDDILDISKIEAERLELTIESLDLYETCDQVVQVMEPLAAEKALLIRKEIPGGLEPIEADAQRLRQVLTNIVGNAVKFTDEGSVTVRVVPQTGTRIPCRIEVVDSGIGIPPDRLGAVLEPFVQADGSTSKRHGGTGLGLSISRSLCEQMGFGLQLRSVEGRGTTVSIVLLDASTQPAGQLRDRRARRMRQRGASPQTGAGVVAISRTAPGSTR
ncbi:MAG: ATP-binding protein [Myxococcota bacterium]